jgi:hypothetical protein
MMKFYGVEQSVLLGGPRWRAREMVTPYDPFLKHSFFADNIGYYSDASTYIKKLLNVEENFFLSPKKTILFDMALVAEKLIESLHALDDAKTTRADLFSQWKHSQKDQLAENENQWNWNSFVFGFEPGTIALKSQPEQKNQNTSPLKKITSKTPSPTQVH